MTAPHHGYALVALAPDGRAPRREADVVLVERLRPDGAVEGPFAAPSGARRTKASRRFAAEAVVARFAAMPSPAEQRAALAGRVVAEAVAAPVAAPLPPPFALARRLAPSVAARCLATPSPAVMAIQERRIRRRDAEAAASASTQDSFARGEILAAEVLASQPKRPRR